MKRILIMALMVASLPVIGQGEREIEIETADGKTITGLLYEGGGTGLVLCHGRMYKTGGASFRGQCAHLQKRGVACLAISFRGYPSDSPPRPVGAKEDVLAAVRYLEKTGVKRVFVLGSSMGGFVALKALPELEEEEVFAGLIVLSAFDSEAARRAKRPLLFVAAEDDAPNYSRTFSCFESASAPKQMIAYKTGGHGQSLFVSHEAALLDEIVAFLRPGP